MCLKTFKTEKIIPSFKALSHDDDKKVVMIDYALENEVVEVQIIIKKKNYDIARCKNVISSSESRETPFCKFFAICGGCDLLHMKREKEVSLKEEFFRLLFKNFKNVSFQDSVFLDRFNSRTRASFHYDGENFGFYEKFSHKVVDIDHCPLLCPELNEKVSFLRNKKQYKESDILVGDGIIRVLDNDYYVSENVFFQSNLSVAAKMLEYVKKLCENDDSILDLYAGVGFFSKALEDANRRIIAVEENIFAGVLARKNLKHTLYINKAVEKAILNFKNNQFSTVIVDPPRGGMSKRAIDGLKKLEFKKLIYVSCNVESAVNDILKIFEKKDKYKISARLFDMYCATPYTEGVIEIQIIA